jgi:hypothetical protein
MDGRLEGDIVHIDVGLYEWTGEGLGLLWGGSKKEGARKRRLACSGKRGVAS